MKKQKKQGLLNAIIVILVIALIMMIISIVYEEKINMSKQPTQNTNSPIISEQEDSEDKDENKEEDNDVIEEDADTNIDTEIDEEELPAEENKGEEYLGEEENTTSKEPEISTDDKVVDLVKKEWGQDASVTFSIEKKNGSKYRVAVRDSSTTVLAWYEVNIETWEVSEY